MTLYEIDHGIAEAFSMAIDPETGEVVNEKALENLEQLQMDRVKKIEGILLYYKNCVANAEAIKNEKMMLAKRQKQEENLAQNALNYAVYALNGEKFKSPRCSASYRKSDEVQIEDIEALPEEYLRFKPEPAKSEIKNALKAGVLVPGAVLVSKQNLVVK